jgi:hypothetical protein
MIENEVTNLRLTKKDWDYFGKLREKDEQRSDSRELGVCRGSFP